MKKCYACKIEKENAEFSKCQLDRSSGICRSCNTIKTREYREKNADKVKAYQQEYDKSYYQENKEEILEDKKTYYDENKEEILENRKEYYQENKEDKQEYNKSYYKENKTQILAKDKEYRINNADKIRVYHNEYSKERRANDPNFRIRAAVSANINFYLKSNGSSKDGDSCLEYLPYTISELSEYLEKQFETWMSWDNYGRYDAKNWDDNDQSTWTWQIDHIIPQSNLPYTSMADDNFKTCWALANMRPLSSKQNFLDGVQKVRHK